MSISADEFIKMCIDDRILYSDSKGNIFRKRGDKWYEAKGTIDSGGYKRVAISWKGIKKNLRAHRIVCFFWNGYQENMTIDHIDHDKLNNNPDNLRLMTNEENAGRRRKRRGNAE